MIRRKSESEILAKDISCKCKCRSNGKQCNSNQWWNNDKCLCECKKQHACEKNYIQNLATCSCLNENNLASIMDDSAITCDEIIEETVPTNLNGKKKSL